METTLRFSVSENQTIKVSSTYLQKWNVQFCIFCQKKDHGSVFFVPGVISGPRISWEGSFERKLKLLVPFLSDQKMEGN
jgi:hypothetical protein